MIETTKGRIRSEAEDLEREWATDPRWAASSGPTRPRTSSGSGARSASSTRRAARRRAAVGAARQRRVHRRARRPDRRPGRRDGEGGAARRSTSRAGRWRPTRTWPARPTPTSRLYPANSVPAVVRRINNALQRADQIAWSEGARRPSCMAPIVADAEAGFGGALNAFELMKAMIEAGAAGVHFEDQLASEKKCGHLGGKVLVPTDAVHPNAHGGAPGRRRARTSRRSSSRGPTRWPRRCSRSDVDARDRRFTTGTRTHEGFYRVREGMESAIARGVAYAPFADMLWCETATPDLEEARAFAEAIHAELPGQAARVQLLAVVQLEAAPGRRHDRAASRRSWRAMGYRFQFITLAGFHALNASMFELARGYAERGHDRVRSAAGARVRDGGRGVHRDAPSGRGRHRLLRSRVARSSPAAPRRRSRSRVRPRRRSSARRERFR